GAKLGLPTHAGHPACPRSGTVPLRGHRAPVLVEAHGGRLWAEAHSGSGATFMGSVPADAAGRGADGGGRRVLAPLGRSAAQAGPSRQSPLAPPVGERPA